MPTRRKHNRRCPWNRLSRIRRMADRLRAEFLHSTAADRSEGSRWYLVARNFADRLSDVYGIPLANVVGVIAALSPRCHWSVNQRWAEKLCAAYAAGRRCPKIATTGNREKAWRIVRGESPLDVLRGPKVRDFFAAILWDASAVPVDSWAAFAAEGERIKSAPVNCRYKEIAEAYRMVAAEYKLAPSTFQAIVWVSIRRRAAADAAADNDEIPD